MSWSRGLNAGGVSLGTSPSADPSIATTGTTLTFHIGGAPLQVPLLSGFSLDEQRVRARDAYLRGAPDEARALQEHVITEARGSGQLLVDDFLFHGLVLYALDRKEAGIATLREGLAHFPGKPELHENLAVFLLNTQDLTGCIAASEAALAAGSRSPNVHDCLCDAYNRLGRYDLAVPAGRAALQAKDRRFGASVPLATVPARLPPAFNPTNPAENVIAFCLWGNQPRYQVPLLENARILAHLFPAWSMRVYHDDTVDRAYLARLAECGAQLRVMALAPGVPSHRKLLWRFDVVSDPSVRRFLYRDADSLFSVKERVAVDAWLQSDFWFHTMRDWYTHTDLILAGMWGGVGGVLPPLETLLTGYSGWRLESDHIDQDVLAEAVWPIVRRDILIHDSIFAPCLGSVPFPPFGHSAPGAHIGQNAFLHFTRTA